MRVPAGLYIGKEGREYLGVYGTQHDVSIKLPPQIKNAKQITHNNELSIKTERIHPEWLKLVGNNNKRIRMCHHDDKKLYCGGCFQRQGIITSY